MNWNSDVIERSKQCPVVVDFWAPWCGPCQYLGPIIEDLAAQTDDWELIKINTDEHQHLMQKYNIQSIPAVRLFYKGEIIASFNGALPKHEIEKWLNKNLPNATVEEYAALKTRISWPANEEGITELAHFIADHAGFADAVIDMAAQQVLTDTEASLKATKNITFGHKRFETIEAIRTIAEILAVEMVPTNKLNDLLKRIQSALKSKNIDEALKALIAWVSLDKSFQNELPRRATIAVFHLLGLQHELSRKYQRKFGMALY